jgi:hypothetical protein
MESEHPVKRKLRQDILPWTVSARGLKARWFYRVHVLFGYTTDLLAAFAAVGFAPPFLRLLASQNSGDNGVALSQVLATIPGWLVIPAAIIMVGWLVLRTVFTREEGQKRAVLARSCAGICRGIESDLHFILAQSNPIGDLNKMYAERLRPAIDRTSQEGAWPWDGPSDRIDAELNATFARLCATYESRWEVPPTLNLLDKSAA